MKGSLNHERLLALSKELRRPLYTLEVLRNDPFTAGVPARKAGAQWFAKLWRRLGIEPGTHLRRIHYVLVSQDPPVRMLDGGAYINTRNCAAVLERTSLDARYLGLVPSSSLVDRRNDEPVIYLPDNEYLGSISAVGGQLDYKPPHFDVPSLCLLPPTILQPFHIEIWCEKSTCAAAAGPALRRQRHHRRW
jgi:hypothetical protein